MRVLTDSTFADLPIAPDKAGPEKSSIIRRNLQRTYVAALSRQARAAFVGAGLRIFQEEVYLGAQLVEALARARRYSRDIRAFEARAPGAALARVGTIRRSPAR